MFISQERISFFSPGPANRSCGADNHVDQMVLLSSHGPTDLEQATCVLKKDRTCKIASASGTCSPIDRFSICQFILLRICSEADTPGLQCDRRNNPAEFHSSNDIPYSVNEGDVRSIGIRHAKLHH